MGKSFAETVAALRALADESRVRIVLALRRQPLCVCQIVELMQLVPSTISEHLAILKMAGVVTSRKEGRWVYYRLAEKHPPVFAGILTCVARQLERDRQLRDDTRCLTEILRIDPAELCRRQRSGNWNCCERRVSKVG